MLRRGIRLIFTLSFSVASSIYAVDAHAAVTPGAEVICDISKASNLATTPLCLNTGSGGVSLTLVGSPVRSTAGGGSLWFNQNSRGQRAYGSMGSTAGIDSITVEMFLYLSENGNIYNASGSMLFNFSNSGGIYNIYHFGNKLGFNTFNSEVYGIDATNFENGWHHFVFIASISAVDSAQKIYIDGVQQTLSYVFGSSAQTASRVFDSAGGFRVMDHSNANNTWNAKGQLGLLRIYKRALTPIEISANYQIERSRVDVSTSVSQITFQNAPKKGLVTTITATVSAPGKVRFFHSGKKISGCLAVSTTGSGPYTASCSWKPAVQRSYEIVARLSPTDNSLNSSQSMSYPVSVANRSSKR